MLRFSQELVDAVSVDTVEQWAHMAALEEILVECMEKLNADDQRLSARYREGVSSKSLAERLGRPLKTIYGALSRIRQELTECIRRGLNREART